MLLDAAIFVVVDLELIVGISGQRQLLTLHLGSAMGEG